MKQCRKCNTEKPLIEFNKAKANKDGLSSYCKACAYIALKENRERNKERYQLKRKIYHEEHKEELRDSKLTQSREYYYKNRSRLIQKSKKYYLENYNEEWKKKNRDYQRNRRSKDLLFKLSGDIRRRTVLALFRSKWTNDSNYKLLGLGLEDLRNYIEKQFKKGMNWENFGEWEIDHITPLSSAKNESELLRLAKYHNIRPLWKSVNRVV